MPEFFIELFSEEIPARMQARAAEDLSRLVGEALASLKPCAIRTFHGPRRIGLAADVAAEVAEARSIERGPRVSAPEQALAGFLRKHNASRDQIRQEGDFLVLDRVQPGVSATALIAEELPTLLRRFPWPKSMRWGRTSQFTWVRPLRRITCILDGKIVPFDLRDGDDDGHDLASGNMTEGHRFMAPGVFSVSSASDWATKLLDRNVFADASKRRGMIAEQLADLSASHQLELVEDLGLLDEVTGLVEWPVTLLGRIDGAYMDLPAEVMQVSMRVNQRYFALRTTTGEAAPYFAFVANIDATDADRTIVAGNERVLRARFSDARYFWDLDRKLKLESRVPALDGITFHAKLGSQGDRVRRLVSLAGVIAPMVGGDVEQAMRAALLAKADLTTGMVREFPELQGVMGGYYARHDDETEPVRNAIREHYAPKGPSDAVPSHPVAVTVALADKFDTLAAFFAIGEKPSGSGDPYALRRAALGIIRLVRENGVRLRLSHVLNAAGNGLPAPVDVADLLAFLAERLRVQLRSEGSRHDVLTAVLKSGQDDDFVRVLSLADAVAAFLGTDDGANLLAASKRAANILRIEDKKDGPHQGPVDASLLQIPEEIAVFTTIERIAPDVKHSIEVEQFAAAMSTLATLRRPLDLFFDKVTVNDDRLEFRRNRLRLLSRVRATMNSVADFSKIEGA